MFHSGVEIAKTYSILKHFWLKFRDWKYITFYQKVDLTKDFFWLMYNYLHFSSLHSTDYTEWQLLRFGLAHFWQKFRESNVFSKENTKASIWRNIFLVGLNFSFCHTHCGWSGNYGNSLSHFWWNFVKVTVLHFNYQISWLDETFFGESKFFIFPHCTLSKVRKLTLTVKNSSNQLFSDFFR